MSRVIFGVFLLVLLALTGCGGDGPKTYNVSGVATFEGQSIASGDIRFEPEDKKLAAEGGRIENGQFSMKAKAGKNKIVITASRPTGKMLKGAMGEDSPQMEQYLPPKYNQQTTLVEDITNSRSDLKFELTK